MDAINTKFLGRFLSGFIGLLLTFSTSAGASDLSCQSLFETQKLYFQQSLFDSSIESFRKLSSPKDIELKTPEERLAFLEYYSSYNENSTLEIRDYLRRANWWQTKKLFWRTRKLKGAKILKEKNLDKIIADLSKLSAFNSTAWNLLKNPNEEIRQFAQIPNRLIKSRFDQALAKGGLIKALGPRFRPSAFELSRHRNLMNATFFTLATAGGISARAAGLPTLAIDPYLPEIDVVKDGVEFEKIVRLADEEGYDAALEKTQIQFADLGKKQRFYNLFKAAYNWSGKVFVAAFFVGHAYSFYQTDHDKTMLHREEVSAEVSKVITPESFVELQKKISNPDRLGEAVFNKYFEIRHSENPSLDEQSDELQDIRAQTILNVRKQLQKP